MVSCKNCTALNSLDSAFCKKCGATLPADDVQQAKVALMGVRVSSFGLGSDVLTIGAGPLGQMIVRWAHAAGVRRNVVVEPVALRRDLARRGGATAALGVLLSEREEIFAAFGGRQPECIVDATGNGDVLTAVLPLATTRGRVVILGNTGSPSAHAYVPVWQRVPAPLF